MKHLLRIIRSNIRLKITGVMVVLLITIFACDNDPEAEIVDQMPNETQVTEPDDKLGPFVGIIIAHETIYD